MVLMRGLPGSGKSYAARALTDGVPGAVVFSTDDFFRTAHGGYAFEPRLLPEAHAWNQRRAATAVQAGTPLIVIDNTNLMLWEMAPYAELAVRGGYAVELRVATTPWADDPAECARRCTHGVPLQTLMAMDSRFERGADLAAILSAGRARST